MKMIILATLVALALAGAACGGGGGGSDSATTTAQVVAQATVNAKATAMAKAEDGANLYDELMCGVKGVCLPPEEHAALHSSLVLLQYEHIIGDVEAEARAEALYQETKAAWEAAHTQPIIIVRPPSLDLDPLVPPHLAPPASAAPDTSELDTLKHKVNELCREIDESLC